MPKNIVLIKTPTNPIKYLKNFMKNWQMNTVIIQNLF